VFPFWTRLDSSLPTGSAVRKRGTVEGSTTQEWLDCERMSAFPSRGWCLTYRINVPVMMLGRYRTDHLYSQTTSMDSFNDGQRHRKSSLPVAVAYSKSWRLLWCGIADSPPPRTKMEGLLYRHTKYRKTHHFGRSWILQSSRRMTTPRSAIIRTHMTANPQCHFRSGGWVFSVEW